MYKALEFLKKLAKNFFSWGFFAIACSLTFCAVFFPLTFALGGLQTTTHTVTFSGDVDKVIIKKGNISVFGNKDNVEKDDNVIYKITPKDNYTFKNNKGKTTTVSDGTKTFTPNEAGNEIEVVLSNVTSDKTITISDVLQKYKISFDSMVDEINNNLDRVEIKNGNGGTISNNSDTVIKGDDATYTITPKTGYTFKNNKGDKKTIVSGGTVTYDYDNNKITVTLSSVTSAKTITISNVLKIYNISFENGGSNEDLGRVEIKKGNDIISNNSDTVIEGDDATYTITPKTGYTFKEGKTTVTNGTYISNKEITVTLSNVNGNITITISDVLFAKFDVNFLYASDDDKVDKKLNILEIMTISQVTGGTETLFDNSFQIGTDTVTYRFRLNPAYTQSYIKEGNIPISAEFHKKDGTTENIEKVVYENDTDGGYYQCKLNISDKFATENIGAIVKITVGEIVKNRYKITINNTTGDNNNRVLSVNSSKLNIDNSKDKKIENKEILYGEEIDFKFKLDKEYEFVSKEEVKNLLGIDYDDSNLALYFKENEGGNHPNKAKFSIEVTENLEFEIGTNIYKEVSENINFENDTNIANELISDKYRVYLAEKQSDDSYKKGDTAIDNINPYRDAELLFELDKDYYDFDSNFQVNGNKCDDYTIDSKVYKLIKYKGYTDVQENPIVNLKFSGIEPVTHTVVFKGIFEKDEIDDSINVY